MLDIASKRWFQIAKTLAERIFGDFSKVKLKKSLVRVPKLEIRKEKVTNQRKNKSMPISSIINILIKSAVEKAKRGKKEKTQAEDKSYTIIKDNKSGIHGGYGTASRNYGTSPKTSYVDYEKLFSYLGKFRSQSAYENMAEYVGSLNKATESGSFVLADKDSMDKIGRFEKYFKPQLLDTQIVALSLVPVAGLSSAEWEEIKNLIKFDPVMYSLKSKTS